MIRWRPGPKATSRLIALAAVQLFAAWAVIIAGRTIPQPMLEPLIFPLAAPVFVTFFAAMSIAGARSRSTGVQAWNLRAIWSVLFRGTPIWLAMTAVVYFYGSFVYQYVAPDGLMQSSDPAPDFAAGARFFLLTSSVFSVLSLATLVGWKLEQVGRDVGA